MLFRMRSKPIGILLSIIMCLLCLSTLSEAATCSQNLTIITDGIVHNDTIKFKFAIDGRSSSKNLTVEYWVEDLAGAIVKEKRQSPNLGWKSYTPKTDGAYALYLIKAVLILPGCAQTLPAEQYAIFKNPLPADTAKQKVVCKAVKEGISIYLDHIPKTAIAGEEFSILVGIDNLDNHSQPVKAYSYIYRASKQYTPKKANLETLELGSGESAELELSSLANLTPGDYRLKLVAEYGTNKTKELSSPITFIASESATHKIGISHFGISSLSRLELLAEINSTSQHEVQLRLVVESDTDRSETELTLQPEGTAEVRFPLRLPLAKNHLFLRLYQNESLLDISELVLENSSLKKQAEIPYTLVSGDILFNSTKTAYSSSSARSAALVPFLLLAASLILNGYFLLIKKAD